MIDSIVEKTDESLSSVNDFFKSITGRITPNWILLVTLLNGFFLGLITTGFIGDKSVSIYSGTFILFVWQFFIICVFSSAHVEFNTEYLQKFIWSGVIGYAIQWQIFGTIAREYGFASSENIQPPFSGNFANAFFIAVTIYILYACFHGNKKRTEKLDKWTLKSQDKLNRSA